MRRLIAADWAELRAARLSALAEAPYAFSSTLARERSFDEEVWRSRAGSGRTFGAFGGAAMVGLATGLPAAEQPGAAQQSDGGPPDARPGQPDWHLVGMWVAPGYRGLGVADRLVGAVCELARRSGAGCVTLWVTDVNDRARAFYRRLGFVPTGGRELVRPEDRDHWEEELSRQLA